MACEAVEIAGGVGFLCTRSGPGSRGGRSTGQNRTATRTKTTTARNAPTSQNTRKAGSDNRTQGGRTGVPAPRVPGDGPLVSFTPGLSRVDRALLVVSESWSVTGAVAFELTRLRAQPGGIHGATLVVRTGPVEHGRRLPAAAGERTVHGLWSRAGCPVDLTDDPVAEVEQVDVLIAFVNDLDPVLVPVVDRAQELGVPTLLSCSNRTLWPAGSEQRARVDARVQAREEVARSEWRGANRARDTARRGTGRG